eukprot:4787285-Amphidinium_carterae.1
MSSLSLEAPPQEGVHMTKLGMGPHIRKLCRNSLRDNQLYFALASFWRQRIQFVLSVASEMEQSLMPSGVPH